MQRFRVGSVELSADDSRWEQLLAAEHDRHGRPLCLCIPAGVEMYVARVGAKHFVKRMPGSGALHGPHCDSFEPPAELSGLADVLGSAVKENPEDGTTTLKLDFALSKAGGKRPAGGASVESDSVRTDGAKLTLRGLLHLLWEDAGFNRWTPGMEGRRTWYVIRKHLIAATQGKSTKATGLADVVYIPETFQLEHKQEIMARRAARLAGITKKSGAGTQLAVVIAEVKEIAPSRTGFKIVAKHCADFPLLLRPDVYNRMQKRFQHEIELHSNIDGCHLIAIATVEISSVGLAHVEELSLMVTTPEWIPFESMPERQLVQELVSAHRRFTRGMRYNLPADRPLATVVATDTSPMPTALYVTPLSAGEEYMKALEELIQGSNLPNWIWKTDATGMPQLPHRGGIESQPRGAAARPSTPAEQAQLPE